MTGHPSLPDPDDEKRIVKESDRIVEEHVAEPPPKKHSEEGPHRDEIRHLVGPQVGISPLSQSPVEQGADYESGQIGQPVPAEAESPDFQKKRAQVMDIVGEKHRHGSSRRNLRGAISLTVRSSWNDPLTTDETFPPPPYHPVLLRCDDHPDWMHHDPEPARPLLPPNCSGSLHPDAPSPSLSPFSDTRKVTQKFG